MLDIPDDIELEPVIPAAAVRCAALPLAPVLLLGAAAPPPPPPAAGAADALIVGAAGMLGRVGGAVSVLGGTVTAGAVAAIPAAAVLLELLCGLLTFELGLGGSVSGAHAGASTNNTPAIRQHTFRIQDFLRVYTQPSRRYLNTESLHAQQELLLPIAP